MESNKNYPRHVRQIIEELNAGGEVLETLQTFLPTLSYDSSLYFVYLRLGYSPEMGSFLRPVTKGQLLNEIAMEYKDMSNDNSSIKDELLRTFQENGFDRLSTPSQVGLADTAAEFVSIAPSLSKNSLVLEASPQSKGLKFLSLKVKEIICKKGLISYKQLSDELITQINAENTGKEKEEKNVLRRVYDALNVLIAVGVVSKASKKYYWQGVPSLRTTDGNERNEILSNKRYENQTKRENLMNLVTKYCSLRELMCRNETGNHSGDAIQFPFIVVATEEDPTNNIKIEFNKASTHVVARFSKPIKIVEDTDLVINLDLNQKSRHVPSELLELLEPKIYPSWNGFYR